MKNNILLGLLGLVAVLQVANLIMQNDANDKLYRAILASNANPSNSSRPMADPAIPNNQLQYDNDGNASITAPINADGGVSEMSKKNLSVPPSGPKTTIQYEKTEHNFGTIKQNTANETVFTFTNTGTEPLIIDEAKGSCGCTVPDYPKKPVMPGETGEIKVVYSPGTQQGAQQKVITIKANTEPYLTQLKVAATVEPQ